MFWFFGIIFTILFAAFFPRLSLLLLAPWGGLLWGLGFFLMPYTTVACIASFTPWMDYPLAIIVFWLLSFLEVVDTTERLPA